MGVYCTAAVERRCLACGSQGLPCAVSATPPPPAPPLDPSPAQARQLQLQPVHTLTEGHTEMIFALAVDPAHSQFVSGERPLRVMVLVLCAELRLLLLLLVDARQAALLSARLQPPPAAAWHACFDCRHGIGPAPCPLPPPPLPGGKDHHLQVWTQTGQPIQKLDLGEM